MNLDKWRDTVAQIKDNFTIEESGKMTDEETGETREFVVFTSTLGKIKLEFITKPRIIDKKVHYSNRIGSESTVEYIYDPVEKSTQLLVYRYSDSDDTWLPFEGLDKMF